MTILMLPTGRLFSCSLVALHCGRVASFMFAKLRVERISSLNISGVGVCPLRKGSYWTRQIWRATCLTTWWAWCRINPMMVLPMRGTRLSTIVEEILGAKETTILPFQLTYAAVTETCGGLCI